MANLRRSIVASVLFTAFGGPCFLLVVFPWLITRFHLPVHEPAWRIRLAAADFSLARLGNAAGAGTFFIAAASK